MGKKRGKDKRVPRLVRSSSELAQHHFCHILFSKTSHRFERWENRLHLSVGRAVKSHCEGCGYKGEWRFVGILVIYLTSFCRSEE